MSGHRFVDDEELIGKTIAKVRVHLSSVDLLFTDGTYTCINYGGGYYPGEGEMNFAQLDDSELAGLDGQNKPFESREL